MRIRTFTTLLIVMTLLPCGRITAQIPPRSVVPPKQLISDEFIGYLFALVHDDLEAGMTGPELRDLFPEYLGGEDTAIDSITTFERRREAGRTVVRLRFSEPLEEPAPIDILGHRPVMLYATEELLFLETVYRPQPNARFDVGQAHILRRGEGSFEVDFARWLDFLLGSLVDDVAVEVVLAVRYEGKWYGAMAGRNPEGEAVTSVYDMPRGRFLARPPEEIIEFALAQLVPQ